MKKNIFFTKLLQWEYWPSFMFYAPIIPYWLYLSVKAKSFTFWDATNPMIHRSGNGTESKYETIKLIPEKYRPKTILAKKNTSFVTVKTALTEADIAFPLIAKPDIGFRGLLVSKIDNLEGLEKYLKKYPLDFIIQELITYPNEMGVLYYRMPNTDKGEITSITVKEFLTVIGDGVHNLLELITNNTRAFLYLSYIKETGIDLNRIPQKNEEVRLLNIGNHCKGARFLNGNHLINEKLTKVLDSINAEIPDWYYGRLDVRYNSLEEFKQGLAFKILEINGVISEPTHIYDASVKTMSYFKAVRTIKGHWQIIYKIAMYNISTRQLKTPSLKQALGEISRLKKYTKKITKLAQ